MILTLEQLVALRKLYPTVVITRNEVAYDAEDNVVEYDIATVNAEVESAELAKQSAHDAATAKLKKLGLTDDEISALKGTL